MTKTKVLYGAPLRDALLEQVRACVAPLPRAPRLAIVQVGDNPASSAYIRQKINACRLVGIEAEHIHLNNGEDESILHATLQALADTPDVTAIVPQLPLPAGWDADRAINAVPALKDIDGLTEANRDKRFEEDPGALLAATPLGVMRLLKHAGVAVRGAKVAVVGRGRVVGQPLREILAAAGAEVIEINKDTPAPQERARQASVVCAAAGSPGLVTADWVRPGATVIDVGLTRVGDKLQGDADFNGLQGVAGILTPSPGGVGPLTVASLLTNVVDAACLQAGHTRPLWHIPGLTD
ncbi:MAG TPA: bifunctional 5,10-methylenetetrahydrofolate dehydrogenase/5,10-methenyltetrahydrofolate cyclohydrolase [Alphaproteobacteria bacterium]|nr:bifunctional 5,10-methylenetetrahydrofolate dehydrogenase/5,10-methenyltetrahydrofolate cyclohydrolase [Alphaproteobacteria bacterium]